MKTWQILFALCTLTAIACEDVVLFPSKGNIEGTVTDNNGTPLAGVQVSATYEAPGEGPGQQPYTAQATAVTDHFGEYRLHNVWDDVTVTIDNPGFTPLTVWLDMKENNRPVLDLTLNGSPTIGILTLNKTILAADSPDTIAIRVEVEDVFNLNNNEDYIFNLFVKTTAGATMAILPATLYSQSLDQYLFDALLLAGELPVGSYALEAEVQDPDGNRQKVNPGKEITIE